MPSKQQQPKSKAQEILTVVPSLRDQVYLCKLLRGAVMSIVQLLLQGTKVHGPLDDRVVVGDQFGIHRSVEDRCIWTQ